MVRGTPRTYGDRRTEDPWRAAIVAGVWTGIAQSQPPVPGPLRLDLRFRVNPASPHYNFVVSPNGPDIDTLAIGSTLDALKCGRSLARPSLRIIREPSDVALLMACKVIVCSDLDAGMDVKIRSGDSSATDTPRPRVAGEPMLVTVPVARDLRDAARIATSGAWTSRWPTFDEQSRVGLLVDFNRAVGIRNPFSIERIEALIDGLGSASLRGRTLFPPTSLSRSRYAPDDSIVFALVCRQVDLPGEAWLARVQLVPDAADLVPPNWPRP